MRLFRKERTITRRELRDRTAPHVSIKTVDRFLREQGLKKWLAKKRPALTAENARKRLEWALARRNWTDSDFEGVIWSDECSVERSASGRQTWVFRTPQEKWYRDCICPKAKGKGVSLMVWGCFWGSHRGTFAPLVVKSVNATIYIKLLEYLVKPVINRVNDTLGDAVFQQDNAPIHKAKIVMEWFEQQNIQVDDHPPYSPDLNPIEHIWVHLKRRLQEQYPDIAHTPGGPDKVKQRLAEVLPKVWETLPEEYFEKCWRSMPDRVQAVIDADGWYTRY
jgi:transposase